ncbi:DUF3298 domain-containing protein [Pseudoalteromonas sp. BZB3]|uniref:DUF3298 and DUF4163 domain-containing protein n=1 Tax=Pseudoalteromonas sp. BZB3 TaxID=3136670 RepID=UPI0032C4043A
MELELLKELLGTAGLGGFCIGVLFLLFRKIIGAKFFSTMSKADSYKIINKIVMLTWSIAALGLIFWFVLQFNDKGNSSNAKTVIKGHDQLEIVLKKREENKPNRNNPNYTLEVDIEYAQINNLKDKGIQKIINDTLIEDVGANKDFQEEDWYYRVVSKTIKGNLLSVVSEGSYYYHGAAGAGNVITSTNLNIKTGGRVEFKDLFVSGYKKQLDTLTLSELKRNDFGSFFDGLNDDQCYYFTDDYLTLCFDEYEVAPGAIGAVTVEIPLVKIRNIVSLNGPLANAI